MNQDTIQMVVDAEQQALLEIDDEFQTETNFTCPMCGGVARIMLHEWLGHTSACENGCF